MATKAFDLFFGLVGDTVQFQKSMQGAGKATQDFAGYIEKNNATLSKVSKTLLAFSATVVGVFVASALKTREYAEEIDRVSKITGLTAKEVQILKYSFDQEHGSIEMLTTGLMYLQRNTADSLEGNQDLTNAFKALGISSIELKENMNQPYELLKLVADGFKNVKGTGLEADTMMTLFGRSGTQLIPIMMRLSDEIKNAEDKLKRAGLMTDEQIASWKVLGDKTDELKRFFLGFGMTISESLLPKFLKLIDFVEGLIEWFGKLSPKTKSLIVDAGLVAGALAGIGGAIIGVVTFLPSMIAGFAALGGATVITPIGLVIVAIGAVALATMQVVKHWEGFQYLFVQVKNSVMNGLEQLIVSLKGVGTFIADIVTGNWSKIAKNQEKNDKEMAAISKKYQLKTAKEMATIAEGYSQKRKEIQQGETTFNLSKWQEESDEFLKKNQGKEEELKKLEEERIERQKQITEESKNLMKEEVDFGIKLSDQLKEYKIQTFESIKKEAKEKRDADILDAQAGLFIGKYDDETYSQLKDAIYKEYYKTIKDYRVAEQDDAKLGLNEFAKDTQSSLTQLAIQYEAAMKLVRTPFQQAKTDLKAQYDSELEILKDSLKQGLIDHEDYEKGVQNIQEKYRKGVIDARNIEKEDLKGYLEENKKMNEEAAKHYEKKWTLNIDSVKSTFQTSFADMIKGTETFGDVITSVWENIKNQIINKISEIVTNWVFNQGNMEKGISELFGGLNIGGGGGGGGIVSAVTGGGGAGGGITSAITGGGAAAGGGAIAGGGAGVVSGGGGTMAGIGIKGAGEAAFFGESVFAGAGDIAMIVALPKILNAFANLFGKEDYTSAQKTVMMRDFVKSLSPYASKFSTVVQGEISVLSDMLKSFETKNEKGEPEWIYGTDSRTGKVTATYNQKYEEAIQKWWQVDFDKYISAKEYFKHFLSRWTASAEFLKETGISQAQISKFQAFQTGGVVPYDMLAQVHAGEKITPAYARNQGGGSVVNVTVTGNQINSPADETRLADKVADSIMRKLRPNLSMAGAY